MVIEPDIESPRNPRVRAWADLRSRRQRDVTGTFLVEGERETRRAALHLEIVTSIIRIDRAPTDLPSPIIVSDRVFARISGRRHPDGIAAVVRTPDLSLERVGSDMPGIMLVADAMEKPGNIGAMIRSVDAFGAGFLGASLGTDVVNPSVVRSAQGSLLSCPIAIADTHDAIEWCARRYDQIVVAAPDGGTSVWDTDLSGDVAVVVGNEHRGIDARWLEQGRSITIPTRGTADSLNASVAAAIILAEAARQRSS
jgi:TrmH family RNA methyltransferase